MSKENLEIRSLIKSSNLKHWEIAREYGLNDGNFSRLLRFPLSKENKSKIIDIISNLTQN